MKKRVPLLAIVLTALVIAAGAFLPEYILEHSAAPKFDLDYQIVTVSVEESTDYFWRLLRYADYNAGSSVRSSNITTTDVTNHYTDVELDEMLEQCMDEAEALSEHGILPSTVMTSVRAGEQSIYVEYYFDSETMRGFQIGVMNIYDSSRGIEIYVETDLSGGKVFCVKLSGVSQQQMEKAYSDFSSWDELVLAYADYLGLDKQIDTGDSEAEEAYETVRDYYREKTVSALTFSVPSESSTVTLSVMKAETLFFIMPV